MAKKIVSIGLSEDILKELDEEVAEKKTNRSALIERILIERKYMVQAPKVIQEQPKKIVEKKEEDEEFKKLMESAMNDAFKEIDS